MTLPEKPVGDEDKDGTPHTIGCKSSDSMYSCVDIHVDVPQTCSSAADDGREDKEDCQDFSAHRSSPSSTVGRSDAGEPAHYDRNDNNNGDDGAMVDRTAPYTLHRRGMTASTTTVFEASASTSTLAPEHVEVFSELRTLLPMFRTLQHERSGGNFCSPNGNGSPNRRRASTNLSVQVLKSEDLDSDCDSEDLMSDDYVRLSRDIYSVLFVTDPRNHAFLFSVATFAFQMFVIALVLVDVVDLSSPNPLDVPAGVNGAVRAAQFIAVLVSVATQDDLITAINWIHNGYPRNVLHCEEGGALWQWIVAVVFRFAEGALCLAATFILIMRSTEVVGLFLDFLALTFISTIDDIVFALARDGYFSNKLRKEAKYVMSVRVPVIGVNKYFRPLVFLVVSISLLFGWAYIVYGQSTGRYIACKTISVQFGDDFTNDLSHFSGIYEVSSGALGRSVYVEKNPTQNSIHHGNAMFAYCEEEHAWTFSYPDREGGPIDPCNWYAKTIETESYDVSEVPASDWYVLSKDSVEVPFQHFSLKCNDCDKQTKGACSDAGRCEANQCICDEGRFGISCEYESPCESIEVDTAKDPFPGDWAEDYHLLRHHTRDTIVTVYDRPVYTKRHDDGSHHLIMFTGRRWAITNSHSFNINTSAPLSQTMIVLFLESFHGYWSTLKVNYISSPTDVATPTDTVSPVGLQWYETQPFNNAVNLNQPINSIILCSICNNTTNPCGNDGICTDSGTCSCNYGTFGTLCQISGFELCTSINIQFGDALVSSLGSFNGVYDLSNRTIHGRSSYVDRSRKSGLLAYCQGRKVWTFSIMRPGNSTFHVDPCADWKAMSPVTETYDITSVTDDWVVRRNDDADEGVRLKRFSLSCNDCDREKNRGPCNNAGTCVQKQCVCDESRYGLNCEFREPCQELRVDMKQELSGKWPSLYSILRSDDGTDVKVHQRPVYVNEIAEETFSIMMFTGIRWIVSRSLSHSHLASGASSNDLASYLTNTFHGYLSEYSVTYISEASDADTLVSTASPVDLTFYEPKAFDDKQADPSKPVDVSLTCASCDGVDYPCYNGGHCNRGSCECRVGVFGRSCQFASLCQGLAVDFGEILGGDDQARSLGDFSGDFELATVSRSYRPVYSSASGMLAYCETIYSWTFTLWKQDKKTPEKQNPCTGWMVRSSPSNTHDVMSLTSNTWLVLNDGGALVPLSFLNIACAG